MNHKHLSKIVALGFFMVVSPAFAAEENVSATNTDSTVMFKDINTIGEDEDEKDVKGSVFDLPDIALPSAPSVPSTSAGGGQQATNKGEGTIPLPIPMLNLGISASSGSAPAGILAPEQSMGGVVRKNAISAPKLPVAKTVDASLFDIAGLYLGMRPRDAMAVALDDGFAISDIVHTVPKFLEWKYKSFCEEQGYLTLSEKSQCVNEIATKKNERYVSALTLVKPELKETIKVYFTSNFGNNLAYRIVYNAQGDYSLGTSAEPIFKKRERRKAFFTRLFKKYGWPSDYVTMVWTEGFDKASLQLKVRPSSASFKLVLEDMAITDADSYRMFKENRKMLPKGTFSF